MFKCQMFQPKLENIDWHWKFFCCGDAVCQIQIVLSLGVAQLGLNKVSWVPFTGKKGGNWFKVGDSTFSKQTKDPKSKKCNMLDDMDEYMLH